MVSSIVLKCGKSLEMFMCDIVLDERENSWLKLVDVELNALVNDKSVHKLRLNHLYKVICNW